MKQIKLTLPENLSIEEVPKPQPKGKEVLIKVRNCGICGSDIHAYFGKHPFISTPIVLGHEFSGDVEEVGSRVKNIKVGERVTVEPSLVCGKCYQCQEGRYNICQSLKVIGCQAPGALAQYITVPAEKVIPVPESVSYEKAAMIEPTAVGFHSVRRSHLKKGDNVLILGAGPIGILTLQAVRAGGAGKIIITDLNDCRLNMAKRLGADYPLNPAKENIMKIMIDIG